MANAKLNNTLGGLFAKGTDRKVTANSNSLSYTQQLTTTSQEVAKDIMKTIEANVEEYQEDVAKSQESHDAMDELIADVYDLNEVDVEFLKTASDDEVERMIRSQQSKRSRTKSKVMTMDNYLTLMTAGVAENLLRIASGKPKAAGGGLKRTSLEYSDEELQKLANDQEALKKAIRNVQSKKCIMKGKAEFDEQSEDYQKLLQVEEQLKALRISGNPEAAKAVEKQKEIEEALASVDTTNLKAADAKALLDKIKETLATK